jgi:hypothetical protein
MRLPKRLRPSATKRTKERHPDFFIGHPAWMKKLKAKMRKAERRH